MSNGSDSQLFVLRIWAEPLDDGAREWRGRVHHVATDEVRYFRDWPALLPILFAMLRKAGITDLSGSAPMERGKPRSDYGQAAYRC